MTNTDNQRLERTWLVWGRVQGVGFRYAAHRHMATLGVNGTATNLADGSVQVKASGPEAALESLERWLHHGPSAARVDAVTAAQG